MNNLLGPFSLYEFLRVIISGLYFSLWLRIILQKLNLHSNFPLSELESTVLFFLSSIIIGVLIHSIDLPIRIAKRFNVVPSAEIKKEYPKKSMNDIFDSYFKYFDALPEGFIVRTEKYSSFFHLSVNVFITNLFVLLFLFVSPVIVGTHLPGDFKIACLTILSTLAFVSLIASIFTFKSVKGFFERGLKGYKESEEFKKFIDPTYTNTQLTLNTTQENSYLVKVQKVEK